MKCQTAPGAACQCPLARKLAEMNCQYEADLVAFSVCTGIATEFVHEQVCKVAAQTVRAHDDVLAVFAHVRNQRPELSFEEIVHITVYGWGAGQRDDGQESDA